MDSLPYFKFYPADFMGSGKVQIMSPAERGIYISLLCHSWQEGPLPDDPVKLGRVAGASPSEMDEAWPAVRKCFQVVEDGRHYHPRLEKEREAALIRKRKARKAGKASGRSRRTTSSTPSSTTGSTPSSPQDEPGDELGGERSRAPDSESQSLRVSENTESQETSDKSDGASPVVENLGAAVAPIIRQRWWQGPSPPPEAPNDWDMDREIHASKQLVQREGWTRADLVAALAEYEGPPATLAIAMKNGNRHVLYRLMEKVKQRERLQPSKAGEVLNEIQRKAANA